MEQEKKGIAIVIDGKKYEYLKSKHDGSTKTCEDCALREMCKDYEDGIICGALGIDSDSSSNFQLVGDATPAEPQTVTEEQAYKDYQERSQTAGDRGNMLAWAFVCTMFAQLIGSKYFREPYVLAAGGIAYLMLSTMQAWWQTVALWIIKCRIKSKNLRINDYPDWVGGGAWVFYWLKMIVITVTSIYAIVKFIALL